MDDPDRSRNPDGGSRFNELRRVLGDMSPALLTSRLKMLEERGMIVGRKIPGLRGSK